MSSALLLEVVVPGRPPALANPRSRSHWSVRYRETKPRRLLADSAALMTAVRAGMAIHLVGVTKAGLTYQRSAIDLPKRPRKVHAVIHISPRRMDPDNAQACLKADLDGFRDAGLLVNDSPRWLALTVDQVLAQDQFHQKVVYTIHDDDAPKSRKPPRAAPDPG